MPSRRPPALVAGLLLAGLLAAPLAAQAPGPQRRPLPPYPSWAGDLAAAGTNALLGGLTAGVLRKARGGSFSEGFTQGALGGGVQYVGKRVAVQRFDGAGLLGREVAAVGSSVVRNASDGRGALARLVLPLGLVRLYLEPRERRAHAKLDAVATAWAVYGVLEPKLRLDAGWSLSAGAPVFRVKDRFIVVNEDTSEAAGLTVAGTLLLSDIPGLDMPETFAHERVHLLQYDALFLTWTDPLEDRAVGWLPGGPLLNRYVDLNLSPLVTRALAGAFKTYHRRPWEMEANYLMRR